MASFVTRKFREVEEVDLFLNGGLIGGTEIVGGADGLYGVNGLVGKTLIFIKPSAATVTFVAGADPYRLTYKEIKAQIEAAIAAVSVRQYMKKLVVVEATPTNGVTIDKTGTGNTLLGFDKNNDTVGTKFGPISTTAPCLQGVQPLSDSGFTVTVYL